MFIFWILIIVWMFFLLNVGGFGLYGGKNQVDEYNKDLETVNNIFYFKNMPHVIYDGTVPPVSNICKTPQSVLSMVDCKEYCKNEDGEKFTVAKHQIIYTNGYKLSPGTYCKIGKNAICNPYTTITLYTADGWSCFNRTAWFGGNGGNNILICHGKLKDNLIGTVYKGHIPPTMPFNDINEYLPNTKKYRFECVDNVHPITKYNLISFPGNRFIRFTNHCTMGLVGTIDVKIKDGTCVCGDELKYDKYLEMCTNCPVDYEDKTAMQCVICHEMYLPRTAGQTLLPCLYGPHIYVFLPAFEYNGSPDPNQISASALTQKITYATAREITA